MTTYATDWKSEFLEKAERYHKIAAWVGIVLNLVWFISDYFDIPEYWTQFFFIRLAVSILSLIAFLTYLRKKYDPTWLAMVPFMGIAIQNAYMYSVMNEAQLQKHTFAYIALFIGAGMLVLWKPIYTFIVVIVNLLAAILFFYLNSSLSIEEIVLNGGLLTFTVTIFTIVLIHTRYSLTRKEIKARIELSKQKKLVEIKNEEILDSIHYGKKIQDAILPDWDQVKEEFPNSFVLFKPLDIVSGDFYWYYKKDNFSYIVAADCTGHGVPGAFLSMIGNAMLNELIIEKNLSKPSVILDQLKAGMVGALKKRGQDQRREGMDMVLIKIDKSEKSIEFAGAFNPLYIVSSGELKEIKGDKMPVGVYSKDMGKFTNHTLTYNEGDFIYLMSDGYQDQFGGPNGKKFMRKRLRNLLIKLSPLTAEEQFNKFSSKIESWRAESDQEQIDDILLIGVGL
jgi:serine phosphatase RsbU (regulator of sigma subunit)